MSIECMSLVWSRRVGSVSRKAVLQVMADVANIDGTGVWVSKPTIAARSEVSPATVKRAIKELRAMGLIRPTGRRKISNGFTTVYALDLDEIGALERVQSDPGQNEPGITMTPDTGHHDPRHRVTVTPKPPLNHP